MSVCSEKAVAPTADVSAALTEASAEHQLAEGNSYAVATPDNPLSRNLVVSIRASLNDLCLQSEQPSIHSHIFATLTRDTPSHRDEGHLGAVG